MQNKPYYLIDKDKHLKLSSKSMEVLLGRYYRYIADLPPIREVDLVLIFSHKEEPIIQATEVKYCEKLEKFVTTQN